MPNWCNQRLEVRGPTAEVIRFKVSTQTDNAETDERSLNHLFPVPTELIETMEGGYTNDENGNKKPEQIELEERQSRNLDKYGFKNWYDWALNKWGTKWGACDVYENCDVTISSDGKSATYSLHFMSAWGPAVGLISEISSMFPSLTFGLMFTEEAHFFAGFTVHKNGEMVHDGEWDMEQSGEPEVDWDDEESIEIYNKWEFGMIESIESEMESAMDLVDAEDAKAK